MVVSILVYAMLKRIICKQLKEKERLLLWCNNIHVIHVIILFRLLPYWG